MSNHNKKRKLHYLKKCPECRNNGLKTVIRNEVVNGVIYSKRFEYCIFCNFEKEFKKKGEYNKNLFEDE